MSESKKPREWTLKASRFANGSWEGPRFYDDGVTEKLVVVSKADYDKAAALANELDCFTIHLTRCKVNTNWPGPCDCGLQKLRETLKELGAI